jgi:mutator family transposase
MSAPGRPDLVAIGGRRASREAQIPSVRVWRARASPEGLRGEAYGRVNGFGADGYNSRANSKAIPMSMTPHQLEQDKVCLLVMIGARADGTKELVALTDGHRESSESWTDLLRDCKRRGMAMAAPVLAIGDGALGFWAALRDVFPATCEQRCWFHKTA